MVYFLFNGLLSNEISQFGFVLYHCLHFFHEKTEDTVLETVHYSLELGRIVPSLGLNRLNWRFSFVHNLCFHIFSEEKKTN